MIKELIVILILITSVPVGHFLAWLTKEELKDGRRWFNLIIIISLIHAVITGILNINYKLSIILALIYIIIVSFISWKLSFNKKFIR